MDPDPSTQAPDATPAADPQTPPPQPPPQGPWHASIFDPDQPGQFSKDWTSKLPESAKEYAPTLAKYSNFEQLSKGLVEATRLARAKTDGMVKLPGEKSTPEEMEAFYNSLGRPEKPEAYALKPDALPDGVTWDEEKAKAFAARAHAAGLTAKQASELAAFEVEQQVARARQEAQDIAEMQKEMDADLKKAWGPKFKENEALAARTAQTFAIDPNDPAMSFPSMRKLLVDIGKKMSESDFVPGNPTTGYLSYSQQAQSLQRSDAYQKGDPAVAAQVKRLWELDAQYSQKAS